MKKILFLAPFLGLARLLASSLVIHESDLPNFRLAPSPIFIDSSQAGVGFLEVGPNTFRANGTFGKTLDSGHLYKISAEFLSQKLGFSFASGHTHRWVNQGAIGAKYRYLLDECKIPFLDFGLSLSEAFEKKIPEKTALFQNALLKRRIAGSKGVSFVCQADYSFWETGLFRGSLFYDYAHFEKHYSSSETVQGPGIGLSLDQRLFRYYSLHLGVDFRPSFIFYKGSLASSLFLFKQTGSVSFFAERAQGRKHLPSSSRVGVELGFAFGKLTRGSAPYEASCDVPFLLWMKEPAVYMPEVLAISDQKKRPLALAPVVLGEIGSLVSGLGPLSLDVSSYFSGTGPLIFGATNLPSGVSINPLTGVISGTLSATGTFVVSVQATNYAGRAAQQFNWQVL